MIKTVMFILSNSQYFTNTSNCRFSQVCCLTFPAKAGIPVLYLSTDYVFDGNNPPYSVDAEPKPLNKYGFSKLEGERTVMAISKGEALVYKFNVDNRSNYKENV